MKKIIDGKLYNTCTAKEVGSYGNGLMESDFQYLHEVLYLKKTGEYFLYGAGSSMSKYGERAGRQCWGTQVIIPYTEEEAKEWAVKHMDADDYMELFGAVEE